MGSAKLHRMELSHFDDLLAAARQQREPQRLLLVFASASLPEGATPEQRERFEAGLAGEIAPLMCVDKDPAELEDFGALCAEAAALGQPWSLVFAAALGAAPGRRLDAATVNAALERMVESVKSGRLQGLVPFDRAGDAVLLDQ